MIADVLFFAFMYAIIGVLAGLLGSAIFMEAEDYLPGDIDDTQAGIAFGTLWPITIPIALIVGGFFAIRITYWAITGSFGALWSAYVNKVEEKVR